MQVYIDSVYIQYISSFMMPKKLNPDSVSKKTGKAVLIWFPEDLVKTMDEITVIQDTDRSKFIRNAVRKAMAKS